MADELRIAERPELHRPVLVTAFRGWNDGGQGASLAAGFLAKAWGAARFADIDPEDFYDFQVSRPHVSLVEGVTRKLDWPENAFYHAHIPEIDRDAVLLLGIEPNTRWRRFTELIVELSLDLQIELVVSLGSLLADVPHTRPSPVTGSYSEQVTEAVAADPDTQAYVEQLEQRVDELGPQFDVPSGDTIAAELSRYLREREEEGNGHPEGP